jgi:hypothetical protein
MAMIMPAKWLSGIQLQTMLIAQRINNLPLKLCTSGCPTFLQIVKWRLGIVDEHY